MPTPLLDNRQLGTDVQRPNLLVNGGLEWWQRGNGPFTGAGAFHADRWSMNIAGGDTMSISRDTTNVDVGSGSCAAVTYTRSAGSGGTFNQNINDQRWEMRGRTLSFSVRIRASVPDAARARILDGSVGTFSPYHTGSGTYETLTVTATMQSDLQTSINVGPIFEQSGTYYVDNAMLVVGEQPVDYAPAHPHDELTRCRRYFWLTSASNDGLFWVTGYGLAGTRVVTPMALLSPTMAATPTFTASGAWGVTNCSQPLIYLNSQMWTVDTTVTAAGNFSLSASGIISLRFEANP